MSEDFAKLSDLIKSNDKLVAEIDNRISKVNTSKLSNSPKCKYGQMIKMRNELGFMIVPYYKGDQK